MLNIAEVLRHGQARQGDAQTRARRLVHLAEDEGSLVKDARLFHFADEVVALTGTLADAGEHGDAAVVLGHALDHLLDEDGLTDARTAEEADLATLHVGGQQVDDLDAGLEHLGASLKLVEGRGLTVDRPALGHLECLTLFEVEHVAGHVEDVALGDVADGYGDRRAGVGDGAPRTRPSVGLSAMVRTRLSPRCWATSSVIVKVDSPSPWPARFTSTVSALYSGGMRSGETRHRRQGRRRGRRVPRQLHVYQSWCYSVSRRA